jgi:hypothetical protein
MMGLGLSGPEGHSSEIRVGFRTGLIRSLGITIGGAGAIGTVVALINLVQHQPQQFFDLLARWGWIWIIALAGIFGTWDLAKRLVGYVGKLAESVSQTAIAMNRIAEKDDRERDRMVTEMSYVSQRMQRMTDEQSDDREERREHHREVIAILGKVKFEGEQG